MASSQELQVQQKRELEKKEESTIPVRVFLPNADIHETEDGMSVILEMPGVDKSNVEISVDDGLLRIEGRVDFSKYQGLVPVYTEYNVGNYARSFRLPEEVDQAKIEARMTDGVLTVHLPKLEKAKPRAIKIK